MPACRAMRMASFISSPVTRSKYKSWACGVIRGALSHHSLHTERVNIKMLQLQGPVRLIRSTNTVGREGALS